MVAPIPSHSPQLNKPKKPKTLPNVNVQDPQLNKPAKGDSFQQSSGNGSVFQLNKPRK
jgi:hypothetical protein